MQRVTRCFTLVVLFFSVQGAPAEDWTGFRGPRGLGTSDDTRLPVRWSKTENVRWKTELPGLGSSTPITLDGRIYLTCYSGYGVQPNEGSQQNLLRHVVCLDRKGGEILWSRDFEPKLPESEYSGRNNSKHGYSSSTPTTDGERLYVFFGKSGVYGLDLSGNEIWRADVGERTRGWGSSNSPVLYRDLLIINASIESESLVALNKKTGKEVWRAEGIRGSWNTPLLVDLPGGGAELVVCIPEKILAFDPADGRELWSCKGIPDRGYVCPSVISNSGVVYAIGGRKNTASAVRAGGRGDVTETHRLWETGKGSNVSSPVYREGHIYWVHESRGIAYCLNAATGETVYEKRLTPRPRLIYSSVTFGDGKLYCLSQDLGTYVIAAQTEFKLLAHNVLDDDIRANASIVVSDNQLLLRNDRHLYCIGMD